MDRLTSKDLRTLNAFLEKTHGVGDPDWFVTLVTREIPAVVPCDIMTYNEINPRRRRVAWVAEPAETEFSGSRQIFERHMHEHPVIGHWERRRDGHAVKLSDFVSLRQFRQRGLYHEFYRRIGVDRLMAIQVPAPPPLVIGIAALRYHTDFSERDRLLLTLLGAHLVQTYQNAEAVAAMQHELTLLRRGIDQVGCGLIELAPNGRISLMTARAQRWLVHYFGAPDRPTRTLPEALAGWVRRHNPLPTAATDVPPPRKVLIVERDHTRIVARLLSEGARRFLILEEQTVSLDPASVARLGLSRREAEVLRWAADGKTNAAIATVLGLSPHTIKRHLEDIYRKLGVETRAAAVARALQVDPGRHAS